MRYGRFGLSFLCLRIGLGIVFLWIGIDIFRHTETWIGFIPTDVPLGLSRTLAVQLTGLFDVAIGLLLMMGAFLKVVALLACAHILVVLGTQGINAVLIRDVGLLGGALALFFWPHGHARSSLRTRRSRRFKGYPPAY